MLHKYFNDLKLEFRGYNSQKLMKDAMAGLTVAAVALPLALAFGVSSGASAASGLLTAIISGIAISIFGGAFYQISGPTGAMAAILMSIIAQYGLQGVFIATFMAGIMLVLAGVLRLGRLTAFIPMPVITGFTSGIAIVIALGQIDNFFGVSSVGGTAVEKLSSYFVYGFSPDWMSFAIGAAAVLIMLFFPKKWSSIVPSSLIAIIAATAVSMLFSLDIASVGTVPSTFLLADRLSFADMSFSDLQSFLMPAFSIAALCMVESLLCGASAGRMTGVKLDSDRELIAQGIGNILAPLFGGIPATAAIARTSVAVKSGAQTRLAGVFHAVVLLISMLLLGPVMSHIPLSALAGVLMVTAWRMNDWSMIKYIFSKHFNGAIFKYLATMLATVVFDLTTAIVIGVALALIFLIAHLSSLEIHYEPVNRNRLHNHNAKLPKEYENAMVIYITGTVIFSNTQAIAEIAERLRDKSAVIFSVRGMSYMDISGAQMFLELLQDLKSRGVAVSVCGVADSLMEMIKRSGIEECVGQERFFKSVEYALDPASFPQMKLSLAS